MTSENPRRQQQQQADTLSVPESGLTGRQSRGSSADAMQFEEAKSDEISQFRGFGSSDGGSLFNFGGKKTFKQQVQQRKEKNIANQNLAKWRKLIQKKDSGSEVGLAQAKLKVLPLSVENDPLEALLYIYFTVRYYDEHLFKVILSRTSNLLGLDMDTQSLFRDARSYHRLVDERSYDRWRLNQACFETALDKDYVDVAFHFIENGYVSLTWEMVRKMLSNRQEYLVKQCIKYQVRFDASSAQIKKVVFAGRSAQAFDDRAIRLVDFI